MEIKKGIGVSPGVVISTAVVLDAEDLVIPKRTDRARASARARTSASARRSPRPIVDLTQLRDEITAKHGKEIGGIFDFHLGILQDKSLLKQLSTEIRRSSTTAEYAVSVVMRRYANMFLAMPDRYLSERVKDIHDIEKSLLRTLIGQKQEDLAHLTAAT